MTSSPGNADPNFPLNPRVIYPFRTLEKVPLLIRTRHPSLVLHTCSLSYFPKKYVRGREVCPSLSQILVHFVRVSREEEDSVSLSNKSLMALVVLGDSVLQHTR